MLKKTLYTKLPHSKKDLESLCSFFTPLGRAQRPKCDASRKKDYVVSKRAFNKSIKVLHEKIKTLPKDTRDHLSCFYVSSSGIYVALELGLLAHEIHINKNSIFVPTSALAEIVENCRACGRYVAEILVVDDIFDSGETAAKVFLALNDYFADKKAFGGEGIEVRVTFAVSIRRKQEYERDSYGFSTIDFNAIPRCRLLYGIRSRTMKYFRMPWEKLEKGRSKRRKK